MKNLAVVTLLLSLLIILISNIFCVHKNHIGTWKGKSDSDESIKLVFKENNELEIYLSRRGKEKSSYHFLYSKDPIWLDIDLVNPDWRKDKKLYCIAKFVGEDELHIGLPVFISNERPINLSPENIGELWILKKSL